jgi:lipoprotein-releasing system permease protein
MSVLVISLVIWLVLIFLSVTTGIEKNWHQRLTSLHAPLRVTPTDKYYSSYYYQIDSLASASNYTLKTVGEKSQAALSDPYAVDLDPEIPFYWPQADRMKNGQLRDPVKVASEELTALQKEVPSLAFQDYEIGGALLRLNVTRPSDGSATSLSQMSYLLSLTEENPRLHSLLIAPDAKDLTHLLRTERSSLKYMDLQEVQTQPSFSLPPELLPINEPIQVYLPPQESRAIIPLTLDTEKRELTQVVWDGSALRFKADRPLRQKIALTFEQPLLLKTEVKNSQLFVSATLQGKRIAGVLPFKNLEIAKGSAQIHFTEIPASPPPWAYTVNGKCYLPETGSILLPKSYRESGVLLGNKGSLSYTAPSSISSQEQRILVQVAGFYDPGIMSIGNKCLIVPSSMTRAIHSANQTFSPDGTPTNGFFVWTEDLSQARHLKEAIEKRLETAGISPYWKVATYEEFEFSKDLLLQFRSDRTLLLLIAAIILLVACCNIISLLVLLVNDKKKEIAILQSMGASFKSIALIFGFCGITMGLLSCLLGGALALFTLKHLDVLVSFLSALQGHAAFNPAFFGQTLPNQLSYEALLFVCIATPILSLSAGLIPAIKASRIRPSSVLRSE